jgi:hypothetical protein
MKETNNLAAAEVNHWARIIANYQTRDMEFGGFVEELLTTELNFRKAYDILMDKYERDGRTAAYGAYRAVVGFKDIPYVKRYNIQDRR